jgi:GMP synthase-like glutamine amidotransferase
VRDVATNHPQVRIIGICFGHQIIASALGGECVPNDGHWEIGVTEVLLTPTGKEIFGSENIVSYSASPTRLPKITLNPGNSAIPS